MEKAMSTTHAPIRRPTDPRAQARSAVRSADPDRAVNWTVAAALAVFLAVLLAQIAG
jgi:hypothetical protein